MKPLKPIGLGEPRAARSADDAGLLRGSRWTLPAGRR